MARVLVLAVVLCVCATPAAATPVLDVLSGSDGNFGFSVVHTSTGCSDGQCGTVLDSVGLGGAGGSLTASGGGTLLDLNVQLVIGSGTYDASGVFDLAGLLDNSAQLDKLLGTLELTHVAGTNEYGGLKFLFEDRNYSSAVLKPNSLNGDTLSLWGATAYNGPADPAIGDSLDLIPGGTGIDLRLKLANPVPEPQGAAVFAMGMAVVGSFLRRRPSQQRKR